VSGGYFLVESSAPPDPTLIKEDRNLALEERMTRRVKSLELNKRLSSEKGRRSI
jgi:hypothetical protein